MYLTGRQARSSREDLRCIQRANTLPVIRCAYAELRSTSSRISTECKFEVSLIAKRLRRVGRKKARQNSAGHGRSALRRFYAHRKNTTDGRYSRAGDNPQ